MEISKKQQKILGILLKNPTLSSSDILTELVKMGEKMALVTVKRMLSQMARAGGYPKKRIGAAGHRTALEVFKN